MAFERQYVTATAPRTPEEIELTNKLFSSGGEYNSWANIHSWVVIDGEIYDPTPVKDFMTLTCFLAGLNIEKPYYEEFSPEKSKDLKRLTELKWDRLHPTLQESCGTNPEVGHCYFNAHAMCLKNPNAEIKFGKMGYYFNGSNKVFLQWGEQDKAEYEAGADLMVNKFMFCAKRRNKKLGKLLKESPRTDKEIEDFRAFYKNPDPNVHMERRRESNIDLPPNILQLLQEII